MNVLIARYLIYVAIISVLVTIINAPISGFGQTPQQLANNGVGNFNKNVNGNFTNPIVQQGSNSFTATGSNVTSVNSNPLVCDITNNTPFIGWFIGGASSAICTLKNTLAFKLSQIECNLGNSGVCNQSTLAFEIQANKNSQNNPLSALVGNTVTGATNNNPLSFLSATPIPTALSIIIIFLGFGWLAGTFGAGILAPYMARVGIAVSMFYYMSAQFAPFGVSVFNAPAPNTISFFVMIFVYAIMGIPALILLYESFGNSGPAGG